MYKIPLNIGTLAGLTGFAIFLLMYAVGISPLSFGRFAGFWVPVGAVIWAGFSLRKTLPGGYMTYMQGLMSGMITVFVWASCKAFLVYIFMFLFDQQVVEQFIDFNNSYLDMAEKITGEAADSRLRFNENSPQLTPGNIMWDGMNTNVMYGTFIAFIVAFITKRVPRQPMPPAR